MVDGEQSRKCIGNRGGTSLLTHNGDDAPVVLQQVHGGTKVDLWLGRDGRLTAQIIDGSLTSAKSDVTYFLTQAALELGFSEAILPFIEITFVSPLSYQPDRVTTNVRAIVSYSQWPIIVADRMAEAAQGMVGYFTGHSVKVEQMGPLKTGVFGDFDTTVEMSDQAWTEPFELSDDCVFCRKMTDQSVLDRVAGFQWAMDKEVANRFGAGLSQQGTHGDDGTINVNVPKHHNYDDTIEGRRAYHQELKAWYVDHPTLLKVVPLIDLPIELQRTLCIQWNHAVRDYLKEDPRFIYREEDGMYFWMAVKRSDATKELIPEFKTRSQERSAALLLGFPFPMMFNPWTAPYE